MRSIAGLRSAFLLTAIYATPQGNHQAETPEGALVESRQTVELVRSMSDDAACLSVAERLTAEAMKMPEVRIEMVTDLRRRIADGSYFVSSEYLAGSMMDSIAG